MELIWIKTEKLIEHYASGIIDGEGHDKREVSVVCLCVGGGKACACGFLVAGKEFAVA